MTIPFDKLHLIAASLEKYRQSGLLKFDGRDAGNYHGSCWNDQAALLQAADPTGLALAMLLAEMIEATIKGSLVKLERILREPDFVAQLAHIQQMESDLNADIDAPRARLTPPNRVIVQGIVPVSGAKYARSGYLPAGRGLLDGPRADAALAAMP